MRSLAIAPKADGGTRVDGRALGELREVRCSGRPLAPSQVHGASLFSRGETQSLCMATVSVAAPNAWGAKKNGSWNNLSWQSVKIGQCLKATAGHHRPC